MSSEDGVKRLHIAKKQAFELMQLDIGDFLPYTFFLLNGDMALNKNRQIFVHNLR